LLFTDVVLPFSREQKNNMTSEEDCDTWKINIFVHKLRQNDRMLRTQ